MKKLLIVLVVAVMFLFAGCSSDNGGVVGTVNGQNIYQDELDYYFAYYFEYYYQNYYSYYLSYMGVDLLDEESASSILGDFERSAWDAAVNATMIQQLAAERGLTYEDNYLRELLPWGNYQTIKVGTLNSQLYEAVREEMLAAMEIDDEQTRAAYEADPSEWDSRKTSHILISCDTNDEAALAEAKAKAEELIQQLNGGADFAQLAKDNSDDGSAANGGALDTYVNAHREVVGGDNTYFSEFVDAAFALENVGDYTQKPVLSQAGYHIIKLDDIREGYESSKEAVAASLKTVSDEALSDYVDQLLNEARAAADINRKAPYKYYVEPEVDDTLLGDDLGDTQGDANDEGDTPDEGADDTPDEGDTPAE